MYVSQYNYNTDLAFKAHLIENIKLKSRKSNGTYKLVRATFSELSPNDDKDKALIEQLAKNWQESKYIKSIQTFFTNTTGDSKFYITKIKRLFNKSLDNITCIMQTSNPKDKEDKKLYVAFLQSSPEIVNKKNASPIKGSGEISMYEAVKFAKENKMSKIELMSTNNSFYKKLNMKEEGTFFDITEFTLDNIKFDDFMSKIKQKYKLK